MKGADIDATTMRIFSTDLPLILKIVNRYASGVPMAMESTVAVMDTLKLLIRVSIPFPVSMNLQSYSVRTSLSLCR